MEHSTEALAAEADELYALPLGEFISARDARARDLRAQDRELSDRVKRLRKPSAAAWVLNLLVRREPAQIEQMLAVGSALRDAAAELDGEQMRSLTRQRRQVTAALVVVARTRAREEGLKVSAAVAEQVEDTLTAALLDQSAADALRSGLLTASLSTTGLDDLDVTDAVAVPGVWGPPTAVAKSSAPVRPDLRVVPDPDAELKRRRAAQDRVAAAEAEVDQAVEELEAASRRVSKLEARSMQLLSEIEELRRRIADLEVVADQVDEDLEEAEEAKERASEALRGAERGMAGARSALDAT